MKKFFFLLLTIFSFSCFAQFVGQQQETGPGDVKIKPEKGIWKNRFYLIWGYDIPMGIWKKAPNPNNTIADAYLQNTGFGAQHGASFEIGNVFYLKRLALPVPDNMKFGINVTWLDVSYNPISSSWSKMEGIYSTESATYDPFVFIGAKLGLICSYNLKERQFVDAYFNLNPTYSLAGDMNGGISSPGSYNFNTSGSGFGLRSTLGANYRMGKLSLGMELMMGGINYNSTVNINITTAQLNVLSEYDAKTISRDNITSHFATTEFRLKAGFAF